MELLIRGFEYDAWANRLWLRYLSEKGLDDPDMNIFRHILSAQEIWCKRCEGIHLTAMPQMTADDATMTDLLERWISLLSNRTDDPVISFKRTTGEAHELHLSQIAQHVVDHGTYHRGELRGLCRARGDEDFPESGWAGYFFWGVPTR